MFKNMFERLQGTPCASCQWMGWDLLDDAPCGLCVVTKRNRYGKWKSAVAECQKKGFAYFVMDAVKAAKVARWEKENSVATPDNAAPLVRAIQMY